MLASTALVLMMTVPGLALFYGGMVRKKNILATLMQCFAITCIVTIVWTVAGYSLAFTAPATRYVGDLSRFMLHGHRRSHQQRQRYAGLHAGGGIKRRAPVPHDDP